MKIIIQGIVKPEMQERTVKLGENDVKQIAGVIVTKDNETIPVIVWGDQKCDYWKRFSETNSETSIVVDMTAKSQTFHNHEGQATTVPVIRLKLYSYLGFPPKSGVSEFTTPNSFPPPPQQGERVKSWNTAQSQKQDDWFGSY